MNLVNICDEWWKITNVAEYRNTRMRVWKEYDVEST